MVGMDSGTIQQRWEESLREDKGEIGRERRRFQGTHQRDTGERRIAWDQYERHLTIVT
jgi:hypothetical protein